MATFFVSGLAVPPASWSRSSLRLVVGLAALIMGFAVFLLGTVPPEPRLHRGEGFARTGNRAESAQDAAGRDATRNPRSPGRRVPGVDRSADLSRSETAANSLEKTLTRGRRAESAHLATIPLQQDGWDARWVLMEMAATQHHHWTRRCLCPVYPSDNPGWVPR